MSNLKAMKAFVEVARRGSFAAAARHLNISTSSISRLVIELEDRLRAPLLRRTTRSLSLTDAGERYLVQCTEIVASWEGLEKDALASAASPRGRLHIAGAAVPMRKKISPLLPAFLRQYPDLKIELHLDDRNVDLITEGIDVAIRVGALEDSAMIARKCGEVRMRLTCSPDFLERHGRPDTVDDLPAFACLCDLTPGNSRRWPIGRRIPVDGPLAANDGEFIREMTLAGLGLSLLPDFFVDDDIAGGRLISLFEETLNERIGIYVLLPNRKQITPGARAFADYVAQNLGKPLQN